MSPRKKSSDSKPNAGHRRASRQIESQKPEIDPEVLPPISLNPLQMERQMEELTNLMAEQDFETIEEANEFLRNLLESSGGQLPQRQAETPAEKAQELIYEAMNATERRARKLVKDALKLDPNCADAYVLLGDMADSLPDAIAQFRKAVAAGEKSLGADVFEEDRGYFWGLVETRPYMRAQQCLASALWTYGEVDEAIQRYQELLELNPGDNQGIRYPLLDALLLLRRHDEAAELLERFDDGMAHWVYSQALLLFRTEGRSTHTREALETALETNEFVPDFLLGFAEMPHPDEMPEFVSFGDESEAISYVAGAFPVWASTPGAQYWLSENLDN